MRDSYLEPISSHDSHETEQALHISEVFDLLRRHWKLIVLLSVLGLIAGIVRYINTPETWTTRTRIQIERRAASPLPTDAYWMQPRWNPEFYPTQQEILKSRGLAMVVVELLRLWEEPAYGGIEASAGAATPAADEAHLGRIADSVRSGLTVRPVKGTQLIDLDYRGRDPELVTRIANGYADAFVEYGKTKRRQSATNASGFLKEEIEGLRREIAEKQMSLQQYSRDVDLINVDPQANVTLQRLETANRDYAAARKRRIETEAAYNEAMMAPKEALADTLGGGVVSDLRTQLQAKEREYSTKLDTYQPNFPTMVQLDTEIQQLRAEYNSTVDEMAGQVRQSARGEFQTARRQEAALEQELAQLKGESLDVSSQAVEYQSLKSEIENRTTLLRQLQQQQSATDVAVRGSDQSTVRQIDRALLPGSPSGPDLNRHLALGTAAGGGLALIMICLIEFLDRTIKTPDELEKRLAIATLAVIPDLSTGRAGYGYGNIYARNGGYGGGSKSSRNKNIDAELVPLKRPRLAISEAYRALRTALLYASADGLSVIGVTSSTAGEGKSTTTCNLAVVMAQLGKRVLVIDADMRKPRIHQVFGMSNRAGLVNFLVGRCELEESIQDCEIPNLKVCTAGPTPPNPSELISSERMRYYVRRVREMFDVVIIDTPPTLAVTDSTLVGQMADGLVICVRAGMVSREDAKAALVRLRLASVKILGGVLNGFRPLPGTYGKTYNYHYEAYGEYQGERDKKKRKKGAA